MVGNSAFKDAAYSLQNNDHGIPCDRFECSLLQVHSIQVLGTNGFFDALATTLTLSPKLPPYSLSRNGQP